MNLHLKVVGNGIKVALLHGFGFNSHCFDSLVDKLSHRYQFYLLDLPGFGLSSYQPYTLDELLISINKILPERVNLLGWSLGGNIAIAYAQKYPKCVISLFLVSTNPLFVSECDWPSMPLKVFKNFEQNCRNNLKKSLLNFLMLQFPKNNICRMSYKYLKEYVDIDNVSSDAAQNAVGILEKHDLRQAYQNLVIPTFSVLGKKDQLVPASLAKSLGTISKKHQFIYLYENSAHIAFITELECFINHMEGFLC